MVDLVRGGEGRLRVAAVCGGYDKEEYLGGCRGGKVLPIKNRGVRM